MLHLDLLLVEHAQPLQVDHVGQALSEGQAVGPDLLVQPVVGHQVDVGDAVCRGHGDVFPSEFQLHHLGQKIISNSFQQRRRRRQIQVPASIIMQMTRRVARQTTNKQS